MNILAYKIGSGEMNNLQLIEHVAKFGKPMLISTGMNPLHKIRKTVELVEKYNIPLIKTNDFEDIIKYGGIFSIMHPIYNLHQISMYDTRRRVEIHNALATRGYGMVVDEVWVREYYERRTTFL